MGVTPAQVQMPPELREHLKTRMFGQQVDGLQLTGVLGDGQTAVTFEAEDDLERHWALKLVTRESYGEHAPFREVARFASIPDQRYLAIPEKVGDVEIRGVEFVWFKTRLVRGQTLRKFVTSHPRFAGSSEVDLFLRCVLTALHELEQAGYRHGDLHDRNIMREELGSGGLSPEVRYVVIDFSECYPLAPTGPDHGLREDLHCVGQHLRSFADLALERMPPSRADEDLAAAIGHIPGLLDKAPEEGAPELRFQDILHRFRANLASAADAPGKLRDPFDCLSAEDIANDALLTALCFTAHWWFGELEKSSNTLLIGPRGSGKTMLFRRLRLKTKIAAGLQAEIEGDHYVGFYLPCESLFYLRFSDLPETTIQRYKDPLVTFFNLAAMAEVASTLSRLPGFLGAAPQALTVGLREVLDVELPGRGPRNDTTIESLDELAMAASRLMAEIRHRIGAGEEIGARGSTDLLTRVVGIVQAHVPALAHKHFVFMLDDYTEERVPIALQVALHPIVSQRAENICFKMAAHMFGSMYCHPHNLAYDEGRNIVVVNIGYEYLNPDRKRAERTCLREILTKRLANSERYGGTIEQWLGDTAYPGGRTFARAMQDKETRSRAHYHGIGCIAELCSGDIGEMLRMVARIFESTRLGIATQDGIIGAPPRPVPAHAQHKAIVGVSRELLARVRHIRPDGQRLYDVLNAFGALSHRLLIEHPLVGQGKSSSGEPRKDPYDLLTVYVDNLTRASSAAQRVWQRLQRASIFVDIRPGSSQRETIADRATLRRIYCPAFKTMLTSSEHLQCTREQFERFMDTPKEFCEKEAPRAIRRSVEPTLLSVDADDAAPDEDDRDPVAPVVLTPECRRNFRENLPVPFAEATLALPPLAPVTDVVQHGSVFDLFVASLGYEPRTTEAASRLVSLGVRVRDALLLEFDGVYGLTEQRRPLLSQLIRQLTVGEPHRPVSAPLATLDPSFMERFAANLRTLAGAERPRVALDCSTCPSLILSQVLRVLLDLPCDLTILYSEAETYYPTRAEWEPRAVADSSPSPTPPFEGVRFITSPPGLQGDDTAEKPVALIAFPTFDTERTDGVVQELEPSSRVWVFGEPHDLPTNAYRIEMAKALAASVVYPGDPWTLASTFDYREALGVVAGIYQDYRRTHRITVMPHGSKMQTLGVGLFSAVHPVSLVFAMPRRYDPARYSDGCLAVWGIPLGDTGLLTERLVASRVHLATSGGGQ